MKKEELTGWYNLPTTQEIFKSLRGLKDDLREGLANGSTLCSSAEETQAATARTVGIIEGLNQMINSEELERVVGVQEGESDEK